MLSGSKWSLCCYLKVASCFLVLLASNYGLDCYHGTVICFPCTPVLIQSSSVDCIGNLSKKVMTSISDNNTGHKM